MGLSVALLTQENGPARPVRDVRQTSLGVEMKHAVFHERIRVGGGQLGTGIGGVTGHAEVNALRVTGELSRGVVLDDSIRGKGVGWAPEDRADRLRIYGPA